MGSVSWLFVVLLAGAVILVMGAEWPRLSQGRGTFQLPKRTKPRRRDHLRVVSSDDDDISADEFAASVQRDLSRLPTIEERDRKR